MRPGDTGEDSWEGSEPDRPIDIEALRADDELVEALVSGVVRAPRDRSAGAGPESDPESELRAMLSAWVLDVRPETVTGTGLPAFPAPPAPAPGDQTPDDQAAAAPAGAVPIMIGRRRLTVHPRYVQRFAAAAALVVLLSSGLAIGAWDAQPGGTLWPVAKVFYAERAKSIQAAADVSTGLERARTALKAGNRTEAAEAIAFVAAALNQVAPEQGHDQLVAQQQELVVALGDAPIPPDATAEGPASAAGAASATPDPQAVSNSPATVSTTSVPAADPPVVTPPVDNLPTDPGPVDPGPVVTAPVDPVPVDPPPPVEPPVTDPSTDPPVQATTDSAPPGTPDATTPAAEGQAPTSTASGQTDAPAATNPGTTALAPAADSAASTDSPAAADSPASTDSAAAADSASAPTSSADAPSGGGAAADGSSPGLLGSVVDIVTSVVGAILDA